MTTQAPFSTFTAENVSRVELAVLDAASYLVEAATSGVSPEVWVKPDYTLVMSLDLECQRRILARLGAVYPIVAEEDEQSHSLIHRERTYFLVDPLDGTTSCKRYLTSVGGQLGFGPLVGLVKDGRLEIASFFSVPHRKLFTAVLGEGCYVADVPDPSIATGMVRRRLVAHPCNALVDAGVLFFIGTNGESRVVQHLKNRNAIENLYRFGGFANDCSRLAQGFEQASVQFSVKPWDFSAVLLAAEAGLDVWLDPLSRKVPLSEWTVEMNNPVISVQSSIADELFDVLASL